MNLLINESEAIGEKHLTEISRSTAFIASTFRPEEGQQIVMGLAHGGGSGTAVGQVQTTLESTGFTVRVFASTEVSFAKTRLRRDHSGFRTRQSCRAKTGHSGPPESGHPTELSK